MRSAGSVYAKNPEGDESRPGKKEERLMKKHTRQMLKSLLTMMLVVIMVLSTAVTAMAAPGGRWGRGGGRGHGWNWGWNWNSWGSSTEEIAEEEESVVESEVEEATDEESEAESPEAEEIEDSTVEEEYEQTEAENGEDIEMEEAEEDTPEIAYPAQNLKAEDKTSDLVVKVEAPEGALPEGSQLKIKKVAAGNYKEDVKNAVGGSTEIALAVDIAFLTADGDPVDPRSDVKVSVSAFEIENVEEPAIVHISEDGDARIVTQTEDNTASDEVIFESDKTSVYAVIADDNGAIAFSEKIGTERVKVEAPEGAFEPGTEMRISSVTDDQDLAKVASALDDSIVYSLFALDISFWYQGNEVEPKLPVKVTWESANIASKDCKLMHLDDNGKVDPVDNAVVSAEDVVFQTDAFSTFVLASTTRQDSVPIEHFVFNPADIEPGVDKIASGNIAANVPVIEDYTFDKATVQLENGGTDIAVQVGAFIAKYEDDEDASVTKEEYKVYYRTENSIESSDIIVLIANQKITLNYLRTPYSVTYEVVYNGKTYTVGQDTLPPELEDMVLTGPDSVNANTTYEQAVVLSLPRGYSATVRMSNENNNQTPALGQGSEPNYVCNDKWTVTPNDYPFTLNGTYTIANVNAALIVTVNVAKRNSYQFTAQPAFDTAYFGSTSTARYQEVNPRATYTFNGNSTSFSFVTKNITNWSGQKTDWAMDSLNINKQPILVPFVDNSNQTASTTTTLKSGTVITVQAKYITYGTYEENRSYTISVSNCYENISITGGNLHNVTDKPEWVLQERENLSEFDYGNGSYNPLVAGEPMTYDGWQNYNSPWTNWRNGSMQFTSRVIRFKVADGYINPQIKYITPEGTDDYARVRDVVLDSNATDFYHLITSEPDADGYYYFSLRGNSSSTYMGLLSARAELARYGVSYTSGTVSGATIPEFDNGGMYGDGSLRGYNIADNDSIAVSKIIPSDPSGDYVFLYYTIEGDTSAEPEKFAPSEKIPLEKLAKYARYDSEKGEYVIPFVANWIEKDKAETVTIKIKFDLDGEFVKEVDQQVTKNSSIYIDIDSEEMSNFMRDYNWQLFYDEVGSNPYIEVASEDTEVELNLYSKFYVYHPATCELKLHTTKELVKADGTIGTLNIAGLTASGFYYGGYYKDYAGAHEGNSLSGTNLVKQAADDNNENSTLTAAETVALSNGKSVTIASNLGTQYDPVANEAQLAYWTRSNAFTTTMKSSDTTWFGDRGEKDTETLQTGGTGTAVKVARAAIYYLHEVPSDYLPSPKVATVKDGYGNGNITKMFLVSAIDLNIFRAGGVKVKSTDNKGSFAKTFKLTKYDEGIGNVVKTETQTAKDLFGLNGYLTVTDGKNCLADGSYELDPYWITYDSVTIHSSDVDSSHVRTITVSGNTVE